MTIRTGFLAVVLWLAIALTACSGNSGDDDVADPADAAADGLLDIGRQDLADPDAMPVDAGKDSGSDAEGDLPEVVEPEDVSEETDTPPVPDVVEDNGEEVDVEEDVTVPCVDTDDDPCTGVKVDDLGDCVLVPLSDVACDDKVDCTKLDTCNNGVCAGEAYVCDDGNDCTNDYCKGDGNCAFENNVNLCDDNDPCTANDVCTLGICLGVPAECDCKVTSDCAVFEDGNLCNGTLVCDTTEFPYLCKVDPLTVKTCDAPTGVGAECLEAVCTPATGVCSFVPANEGGSCEDNVFCTKTSVCQNGECIPETDKCPDDGQCFTWSCNELEKTCAQYHVNGIACNDENACTVNDTCDGGLCKGAPADPCNDNNPCTDDSCNSASGCVYAPNSESCTDGNKCTLGDKCVLGSCIPGEPVLCNDNVACTQDVCVPESGCVYVTKNDQCDDSDSCTVGDICTPTGCTYLSDADCSIVVPGYTTECNAQLGCLTANLLCGNGNLDPGEACDDGDTDSGDGCDSRCQIENWKYPSPFYPSDIDVTAEGQIIAVAMYGPDGVYAQCFNPHTGWKGTKVLWIAAPQDVNVSSDEPWVVRAGNGGQSLMVWRHYTVPNDYTSVRLDVAYLGADCTTVSPVTRLTNTNTNEFYDMDIDDQGNGVVAFNVNGRGYLRFFGPDGTPTTPDNTELPGPTCKFGMHVALSNLGNGGVVSCQGELVEGVVFWTFDSRGNLTSTARAVPDAEGHTSWYDSHNCYAAAGGEFVIVHADPATGETRRAQFDRFGEVVRSDTIAYNPAVPVYGCYDSYRFGRIKNNYLEGRIWASVVTSGDCFAKDHKRLVGMLLLNPDANVVIDADLPLQKITVDRLGNTYILDNTGDILINYVTLP